MKKEEGCDDEVVTAPPTPSLPRCPHCSMFFVTEKSLETHLSYYCVTAPYSKDNRLHTTSDVLLELPFSKAPIPRKESPPTKKIGIQVRKDYKTEEIVVSDDVGRRQSCEGDSASKSPIKLRYISEESNSLGHQKEYIEPICNNNTLNKQPILNYGSKGPLSLSEAEEIMGKFCDLTRNACKICRKRFFSNNNIRRHAAVHMSWTRYSCSHCSFRSYHKFLLLKHLLDLHNIVESEAPGSYVDEHYLNDSFKTDISQKTSDRNSLRKSSQDSIDKTNDCISGSKELGDSSNLNSSEMVDVLVEEIIYPKKENLPHQIPAKDEEDKHLKSPSSLSSPDANKPKKMTLKLKKVNLNSIVSEKGKGSLLEEKIRSLARSKSSSSYIKTVTVSAKSFESPKEESVSRKLPSPVSSSRERRTIRPPAKRRYPDSPVCFTSLPSKKSKAETPPIRGPGKRWKINISALTSKNRGMAVSPPS